MTERLRRTWSGLMPAGRLGVALGLVMATGLLLAVAEDINGPLGPGGGGQNLDGRTNVPLNTNCVCYSISLASQEEVCKGCCFTGRVAWAASGDGTLVVMCYSVPSDLAYVGFSCGSEPYSKSVPCISGSDNVYVMGRTAGRGKLVAKLLPCNFTSERPLTVVDLLAATGFPSVVPVASNVTFTAVVDPPDYGGGLIRWSGGGIPPEGSGLRFTTRWLDPGIHVVTARCGTVTNCGAWVTATATVVKVDFDIEHVCTNAVHPPPHVIPVTVTPGGLGIPITLELKNVGGGGGKAIFTDTGADTMVITGSQTVNVLGTEISGAVSNMVMRAKLADGSVCHEARFTVVDVERKTDAPDCRCTPARTDTSQDVGDPAGTNAFVDLQALYAYGKKARIDLTLSWKPSGYPPGLFKWDNTTAGTSGPYPGSGIETNDLLGPCSNQHLLSWFDCDNSGAVNDEPRRDLRADVCFFEGLAFENQKGEATVELGPGEQGQARIDQTTRYPAGRLLRWRIKSVVIDNAQNMDVKVVEPSATNAVLQAGDERVRGADWPLMALEDTGHGYVTIEVLDILHNCVTEELTIKVGCSSCGSGACNALGGSSVRQGRDGMNISLGNGAGGGDAGDIRIDFPPYELPPEAPPGAPGPGGDTPPSPPGDKSKSLPPHQRWERVDGVWKPARVSDKGGTSTSYDDHGRLTRIAAQDGFADFRYDEADRFNYEIRVHKWGDVGGFTTNGIPVGSNMPPLVVYAVRQYPDAATTQVVRVEVAEVRSGGTNMTTCSYSGTEADHTRTVTMGNGLSIASIRDRLSGGSLIRTLDTLDVVSNLVARTDEIFQAFPWGTSVVSRVQYTDPGDFSPPKQLVTTWAYHMASNAPGFGQVSLRVDSDGSWERYEYLAGGRLSAASRGFKDADTNSQDVVRTFHDYTPFAGEKANHMLWTPRTTVETTGGRTNAITFRAFYDATEGYVEVVERAATPASAFGSPENQRTVTAYGPDGRIASVRHPDGRLDTYLYASGTCAPGTPGSFTEGAGDYLQTLVVHGTTNSPAGVANRTTASASITDRLGRQVMSETLVFDGTTYVPVEWTATFNDELGRQTNQVQSTGLSVQSLWGCCGKEWEKDANGIEYEYLHDPLRRVVQTVRLGTNAATHLYTLHAYDAEGRLLREVVSAGGLSQTTTNTYDLAGRLVMSRDPAGVETVYIHGGLTETTIRAGLTNVTVRYRDGQPKYTTEDGSATSFHDYGINADGTTWRQVYTGPDGTNSAMWQKTTTDLLGRALREERPGFGGGITTNASVYNTKGQLIRQSTVYGPQSMVSLYEYDDLGQQIRAGLDVNGNAALDLAGPDRVSESASWYEQDPSNNWWQCRASILYAGESSATPTTNSLQKTRLTGLGSSSALGALNSELISLDLLGNTTTSRTYINRTAKTVTQVVTFPDSTNSAVQTTVNGLPQYAVSKTGVTITNSYDALMRPISQIGPRTAAHTHYNALGQTDWTMDAASNLTFFAYDTAGRRVAVTDALSNTIHTTYDVEGRVLATWGATYPVAYAYDGFGRTVAMATTRDNAAGNTNLLTLLPAGVALSDTSAPSYPSDKLDTTRWQYDLATGLLTNKVYADGKGTAYTYTPDGKLARRTWARGVTTDYAYDSIGQMTNINYSDATPDVSFSYDRLGRQAAIADGTGTRSFAYDAALQLAAETNAFGVLSRTYDALGRPAGFTFGPDYSVAYGYDPLGRFSSVSNNVGAVPRTATYSYLPGSDLVAGYTTDAGFSLLRSYEPNRNLIATVSNLWNGAVIAPFNYLNDGLARRVRRVDNSGVTNDFGYNPRSELISALMGTNQFGYAYDPIGNRLVATNNAVITEYLANLLNQYTNIVEGGTPVTPQYDWDGNLTNDARFCYTWNGENQMIGAENGGTNAIYSYDYMGRRHRKIVNGVTNSFLYDGWNLISETVNGEPGTSSTNLYVWGLDLCGTLQGAGGIGGLLSVTRVTPTGAATYYPVADANGNITDYVDTNGVVVAHRDFNPYGNTITASGPMVDDFNFWFSTKYLDQETGLYYYGYRQYSPELGRWLSRDPIGEIGGVNQIALLHNNAIDDVDPLGAQGFGRSLQVSPVQSLQNQNADYSLKVKINLPPKSTWPQFTKQFWQLNHWVDQGYGVKANGVKIDMNKQGDITDVVNSALQNGNSVGSIGDLMAFGIGPNTFHTDVKSACSFSRTVSKTMGWNGSSTLLSTGTHGLSPSDGPGAGVVPQMNNNMRNRETYTYVYEFYNYKDCDCLKYFTGPIQLSLQGKIVEKLNVPGIGTWEFSN